MPLSDFLNYGGALSEDALATSETLDYLRRLGFGDNYLSRAREAVKTFDRASFEFEPDDASYCDFCFVRLTGVEYDVLPDGRDRCIRCSRSVVRTTDDLIEIVMEVRSKLELAFGISVRLPKEIGMANAKEIARRTGETFVATPSVDPRVLGFADSSRDGDSLFIENGSPKLAAITTIAHELVHIWQYSNWDEKHILALYGAARRLAVYEGMATWAHVQYLFFIKEFDHASRQEVYARERSDEYGEGFRAFAERYPIDRNGDTTGDSPFRRPTPL